MIDLVLVTHPDPAAARNLIEHLVREHRIACGQILPSGTSVFFWEGEVRTADEVLLVLKSVAENREILEREIRKVHPYSVPEILFLSIDQGNADYLAWVRDSCTSRPGKE